MFDYLKEVIFRNSSTLAVEQVSSGQFFLCILQLPE